MKKSDKIKALLKISIAFLCLMGTFLYGQQRYELYCPEYLLDLRMDSLRTQIGIKEPHGNNGGKTLKYQKIFGLKNQPYCQMLQYWAFFINAKSYKDVPIKKSAMAISSCYYAKKQGVQTKYGAYRGDLIVWRKGNTSNGHIECVDTLKRNGWVVTIAGNTSNGKKENQREGNGIFNRDRNIKHPLSRILLIKGLVGFYSKKGKEGCNYE